MKRLDEHLQWLDDMVIPSLGDDMPEGQVLTVTTTDRENCRVYEVAIRKPDDDLQALRRITISELKGSYANISMTEFTNYEDVAPIEYKTKQPFDQHFYGNIQDLTRLQMFISSMARETLTRAKVPSRALSQKINEFNNRWLGKEHYVAPYPEGGSYDDCWRLRLCNREGRVYTHHLDPNVVTGHLLRLMAIMYEEAFNAGRREGAVQAFEAVAAEDLRMIQHKLGISDFHLPERARNFLTKERLG